MADATSAQQASSTSLTFGAMINNPNRWTIARCNALRGWRVFPLRRGTKRALLKNWPERATTDLDVIEQWWTDRYRACDVGLATGSESGSWVLDIDCKSEDGFATLAALENEHGPLPDTFCVETPSGGAHLYFAWPTGGREIQNHRSPSSPLGPGLDTRGRHGYVVAPGTWWAASGPDNPTERHYRPVSPLPAHDALGRDVALPQAPDWLVDLAGKRSTAPVPDGEPTASAPFDADEWISDAASVTNGQETFLFQGLCRMRRRGVDPAEMLRVAVAVVRAFPTLRPEDPWTEQHARYKCAYVCEKYGVGGTTSGATTSGATIETARDLQSFYRTFGARHDY